MKKEWNESFDEQQSYLEFLQEDSIDKWDEIKGDKYISKALKMYFDEIGKIPLLLPEEELKIAREIKQGNQESYHQLIEHNLQLVIPIAKRYVNMGIDFEELIQVGNEGLIKAVEKFDPELGYHFSSYAVWWIRQAITRFLSERSRMIRIPVHVFEKKYKIRKMQSLLQKQLNREPTVKELARALGMKEIKVRDLIDHQELITSLNTLIATGEEIEIGSCIVDENALSPLEEAIRIDMQEKVRMVLSTLTPREQDILSLRFGLKDGKEYTLDEIGIQYGITKERVRQIEGKALTKLRQPNCAFYLLEESVSPIEEQAKAPKKKIR